MPADVPRFSLHIITERSPAAEARYLHPSALPKWRTLLALRWQERLEQVTELSPGLAPKRTLPTRTGTSPPAWRPAGGGPDPPPDGRAPAGPMAEIEAALARVASGRFGWCEQCGTAIPAELLTSEPERRYCEACADVPVASQARACLRDQRPGPPGPRRAGPPGNSGQLVSAAGHLPGVEHLAGRLAAIPGVVAVTLGHYRATGTAAADSDWDFGLYYDGSLDPAGITALGWPGRVFAPGGLGHDRERRRLGHRGRHPGRPHLPEHGGLPYWTAEAQAGRFEIQRKVGYVAGIATYILAGELALGRVLAGDLPRQPFLTGCGRPRRKPGPGWPPGRSQLAGGVLRQPRRPGSLPGQPDPGRPGRRQARMATSRRMDAEREAPGRAAWTISRPASLAPAMTWPHW